MPYQLSGSVLMRFQCSQKICSRYRAKNDSVKGKKIVYILPLCFVIHNIFCILFKPCAVLWWCLCKLGNIFMYVSAWACAWIRAQKTLSAIRSTFVTDALQNIPPHFLFLPYIFHMIHTGNTHGTLYLHKGIPL